MTEKRRSDLAMAELADFADLPFPSHIPSGSRISQWRKSGGNLAEMPRPHALLNGPQLPLPDKPRDIEFPIDALGPILGSAAKAIAYHVQTPLGLAGQSVLAAASLVSQSHIDVARGHIGKGPVSLFVLSVAESGDRKSATDRLALKPVRDFEAMRHSEVEDERKRFRANQTAWELRYSAAVSAAKSKEGAVFSQSGEQQLAAKLLELEYDKPSPPPQPSITFKEPTSEGIWRHFQQSLPGAGLFSDEAVTFFHGHGMTAEAKGRMIGSLSQLWDGSTLQRTRAAIGESGDMLHRRLCCHLMIQPVVAASVLADPLLLGQGFIARFLVCQEKSIAGSRFLSNRDPSEHAEDDPSINRYWQRMDEILRMPVKRDETTGGLILETMQISGESYEAWATLHDGIESQLQPNGLFVDIKPFASKAAENAARIAAVMAFVEGLQITTDHIVRAGKLMSYYLESMAITTDEASHDKDEIMARELLEHIKSRGGTVDAQSFKSFPRPMRKAKVARRLLEYLHQSGYLKTEIGLGNRAVRWEVLE